MARVQRAATTLNYKGTLVSTAGGVVSSSRVAHYCEGKERYERIDALDGEARQVLRHNDITQTLWPRARVAVIEQRLTMPDFPGLPPADARSDDSYELRVLGTERVAGYEAQVLLFKPRDTHRFAQRLWAEQSSGLMLRADVVGTRGEVIESASFSDVLIGGKPNSEQVTHAMRKLDGYRIVRPIAVRTKLEAEGWAVARPVPGFQLVGCMRRELGTLEEPPTATSTQVLMAVFSDGLTHVSVFVEPYDAERHRPVATSLGATHTVMTRSGDWWITAVGDVPMATVQLFSSALERRR
ncbi:MAG TPA: MucB/RseB C-terminal domain-containing protein [Burkholderiaceae bacterium]|nr:MucB/RseB C-terminal domain-containing protein [Burkholderiaceae bacterium]